MATTTRTGANGSVKGIGWDIGIKNLAYCVLEQHPSLTINATMTDILTFNNARYAITNWADISLVKRITENMATDGEATSLASVVKITCANAKTDKIGAPICGTVASYVHEQVNPDGTYRGCCKNHYKKLTSLGAGAGGAARMPSIPVSKCYHEGCTGKAAQVLKAHIYKGFCRKHITEYTKAGTHTHVDFLKINRVKNAGKIDINQLGVALFQELDKIKSAILEPQVVLLENQPVLKNPTMKSMQMFLYSYYLMRTLEANQSIQGAASSSTCGVLGDKYIQCYTASKKLDLIRFFPPSEQSRINEVLAKVKSGYMKNKKMSILMVEYLLRDNVRWLAFFKGNPKQDDLADSLLMTLHYFEKSNLAKLKKEDQKNNKNKSNGKTKKTKDDASETDDVDDVGASENDE